MKGRKVSQKGGGLIIRLMKNDRDTPFDRARNFNLKSDRITWNYGVGSMLKSWVGKKKNPGVILFEDIESISDLQTERYDGPDGQGPALEWMEFEIQTKKSSFRRRGRKLYKFHNVWIPPFWGLVRPRTVSERQKWIRDEVPSNSEVRLWHTSLQEKYRIWKVGGDFPPDYGDVSPPAYAESRKRGRSRTKTTRRHLTLNKKRSQRKSLKGRTRTSRRRQSRRRKRQSRKRRRRRGRQR